MADNNTSQNRPRGPGGPMGRRGPGGGRGRIVEKPKDFKKAAGRLIGYITAYRLPLAVVALFAVCSTVFSVTAPKILGNATTEIYNGVIGGTGIDFGALLSILKLLGALYLISALCSFIQGYIMNGLTQRIGARLRSDINAKLHRLPMKYFDTRTNGEILSYITNDVDTVTQGVSQSVTQIITSITTVIGVLYMMISINIYMTAAVLLILPLSGIIVSQIMRRTQPLFKRRQASLAEVNGMIEESYGGHTVIKVFNHEAASVEEFARLNDELYRISRRSEFLGGFIQPVMDLMSNISYVLVAVLGGYAASAGRITVGNIQSFIQYSRRLSQPINQVARISNTLQSTMAAAERVFAMLDEEEEPRGEGRPIDADKARGDVELRHVAFGYDPQQPVIHDLCAHAAPGRKIAIVGPTGAGKTTIVKLLMRFYDVQGGGIYVDGEDIRTLDRSGAR